jgi:uncharacterized protein DUF4258
MGRTPITDFVWTLHAEHKLRERLLDREEIERAINTGHLAPRINRGKADWVAYGLCPDGRRIVVVYDHPHRGDDTTVKVVTVWDL